MSLVNARGKHLCSELRLKGATATLEAAGTRGAHLQGLIPGSTGESTSKITVGGEAENRGGISFGRN